MTERNMSCFFVRELMPIYLEGKLDEARRIEITKHISTCDQCGHFFENIKAAREALTELSKTKVSPAMIEYIKQEHTFWQELYKKINWTQWPNSLKWGLELVVVTSVLALTIHVFPWIRVARTIKSFQPKAPMIATNMPPLPQPPIPQSTPVPTVAAVSLAPTPRLTAVPSKVEKTVKTEKAEETEETDEAMEAKSKAEESDAGEQSQEARKESGFVWRGTLQVDEVSDELTERVSSTILELGGTKAGEVELGWHRGSQRYYHFILPEDNYEKLLSVLNSEGIVELKKIRHPRVMKSGFMRIIMTVEESSE